MLLTGWATNLGASLFIGFDAHEYFLIHEHLPLQQILALLIIIVIIAAARVLGRVVWVQLGLRRV
jgi:hypothetical protein